MVAAWQMGFDVESTSIEEDVSPLWATKTVSFKDYFDEEQLMFGRLVRRSGEAPSRYDYKIFYSILVLKLSGALAVDLAGVRDGSYLSDHFNEDKAFAINTLRLLNTQGIDRIYSQIERIAYKLLKNRWSEVETLAKRLLDEKTVYFN
ncbi:MAG: hypothetical protein ACOCXF_01120 [bacterium]